MLRSIVVIIGLMAVAGWPSLAMPFRGDQALFAVVAQDLSQGEVLYRDHWDITNPGVFWFYQLAGTLFGFTEEGIRLFEWFWVTAFVLIVSEAIRRTYRTDRLSLAPTILVGLTYYGAGYSSTSMLTKVEGLVGLPIFLTVWFAHRAALRKYPFPMLVLAGVAGGIVTLMKLLLVCNLSAAWLFLFIVFLRVRKNYFRSIIEYIGGIGIGMLLILGPAFGYFAAQGLFGEFTLTLFQMPRRFLAEGERASIDRLAESVQWFLGQYTPVLGLLVLSAACRLRTQRDPMVPALLIVLATSFGTLIAQRLSWWSYHFLLPGTMAGVLAAYGWPAVVQTIQERINRPFIRIERAAFSMTVVVLFLESAGAGVYQYMRLAQYSMGITRKDRNEFRLNTGTAYRVALGETAWLSEPGAAPGDIFVCGDPLFHWLSGRKSAGRINGWSLEMYPDQIRKRLADELRQAQPVYLYVSTQAENYEQLIANRFPDLNQLITNDYVPIRRSTLGIWYAHRSLKSK